MVVLSLRDRRSGQRILPTRYSENYLWLLPGETREITLSWRPGQVIVPQVLVAATTCRLCERDPPADVTEPDALDGVFDAGPANGLTAFPRKRSRKCVTHVRAAFPRKRGRGQDAGGGRGSLRLLSTAPAAR